MAMSPILCGISSSGGIPPGPGAFPFFNYRIVFLISCFDDLSGLMRSGVSAGGISGGSLGEGRFSSSSEYSFHRLSWSAWFVNTCPVLSITCCTSLRRFFVLQLLLLGRPVSPQSLSCHVLHFSLPPCWRMYIGGVLLSWLLLF